MPEVWKPQCCRAGRDRNPVEKQASQYILVAVDRLVVGSLQMDIPDHPGSAGEDIYSQAAEAEADSHLDVRLSELRAQLESIEEFPCVQRGRFS